MSKGVIYAILSALAFSIQNVIVKELSYTMSTGEIAFFRGFLSALLIIGLMRAQHIHLSHEDRPTLVMRGVLGGLGMICIFYALRGMPLADVSIISQLSAFFVMLFAAIFLDEVLPKGSKLPLVVIFVGGCLVVRPWNFASFNIYSLFALAQAVFAAGAYTTVSKLTNSGRHHPYEVVLYFLGCAALSGAILMAITGSFVVPNLAEWGWYIALGVITVIAQIWMTDAYATANPVVVSFVSYIGVFFNALWGFVIFQEMLTLLTVAGGILIIGGSMYLTKLKHDKIAEMAAVHERSKKIHYDKRKINETHIKVAFFVGLVAVLAGIHLAIPDFYRTVWDLSTSGNMHGTIQYLRSFGIWAVAVSMIIDIVINIVGFLPSIFISTANGVVFGVFQGTLVSWIAETIGVIISFFFMRTLFRNKAKRAIEKSKMLSKLDHYSTWQAMTVARAVPYSPNGLVTALGALSHISYRDYIIGCFIGKLPSVACEVFVGHDIVMFEDHTMRLTILVIVITIVYGGLWYWHRRQKAKKVLHKIEEDLKAEETKTNTKKAGP